MDPKHIPARISILRHREEIALYANTKEFNIEAWKAREAEIKEAKIQEPSRVSKWSPRALRPKLLLGLHAPSSWFSLQSNRSEHPR